MTPRILGSLALALLLVLLLWPPAFERSLGHPALAALDRRAAAGVEAGMTRALAAFALARGLNAVISVVQGTQVQLAPAGLGVTLTPGEVLDPLNDLVERFSWVMLASATALGMQRFLLAFGPWLGLKLVLSAAVLVLGVSLWWPAPGGRLRAIGLRLVGLGLLLRLAVPLTVLANQGIYRLFLASDHATATAALAAGQAELEAAGPEPAAENAPGLWQRLRESGKGLSDAADLRQRLEALQQRAAQLTDHILRLIVVFLLDTLLLPLALLWALWRGTTRLLRL